MVSFTNPVRPCPRHAFTWRRCTAALLAGLLHAGNATAAGMCTAPWAVAGGLQGGQGLVSSLLGGLLGGAAGAAGAGAQAARCMPAEPASLDSAGAPRLAGNPVDVASGAKLDRAIDVHLPAQGPRPAPAFGAPLALLFSRQYSSAGGGSAAFGPGWRHAFETRLHAGRDAAGRRRLQVLQADGRAVRFGGGVPLAGDGSRHQALRPEDGVLDVHAGGRFAWRWRDGRQLRFGDDGRLREVIDGSERLVLGYEAGAQGRLATVADASGRRIWLRYGDDDSSSVHGTAASSAGAAAGAAGWRAQRLVAVELPDGARVRYGYDADGRLTQVLHPGGAEVRYRYAHGGGARLAAVVLPDGRASEYRYDDAGRVVHARAPGAAESDALALEYRQATDGEPGGETVLLRGGAELARYRWGFLGDGETRALLAGEGAGCEACPPTGVRYAYRDGRVAGLESRGRRWHLHYDGRGRLVRLAQEASPAGGAARSVVVQWSTHALLDRPLRVRRPSVVAGREHLLAFRYGPDGSLAVVSESGFAPEIADGRDGTGTLRVVGARAIRRVLPVDAWARAGGASLAGDRAGANDVGGAATPAVHGGPLQVPAQARPEADGSWALRSAGGGVTRFWLDDFGRVVASALPDAGPTRWKRDAGGRLLEERTADGARASYRYDAQGRLVGHLSSRNGGAAIATRYRHVGGRLVAVEHPAQSEAYDYDPKGRLASRKVRLRLASGREADFETRYAYEADARKPAAWSLPDGSWLRQVHDPGGQVVALERGAGLADEASWTRLAGDLERARGGLVGAQLGNGSKVRVTRGAGGLPVRICHRSPGATAGACDLLDHRLGFDGEGRLLAWRRGERSAFHVYDGARRLVQVLQRDPSGETAWRQAYDADGNRLPEPGRAGRPAHVRDRAGRLLSDERRRYRWNAMGLLAEVSDRGGKVLAAYRYNHRGERVASFAGGRWRHHLFDEQRRPLADLDDEGRILRQYVHVADRPLVVIDRLRGSERDGNSRAGGDRNGQGSGERIAFLHLDHRGAPVLATDVAGAPMWQAEHAPFGRVVEVRAREGFELALRLPGQLEDPATGLHYNDHRWYDPDTGRYLSPDPLGLRGGPNPYAYAANDPLTRVDPTGLLLFAFDGTGNGDPPPRLDDWSNVYKLSRAYADGRVWYMAGVGSNDAASGIRGGAVDAVDARTARARVDHMLGELARAAALPEAAGRWLDVDVIGFSRGAAMARDFANRVADRIESGTWERLGACVRLRFLGLWDTVAQFGVGGILDAAWKLSVPEDVAYTAHAVALNEHRTLFPAESIAGSPLGGVRIERGFVGAHSDVGGSYAEGDLSDVALGWMHAQAQSAGVRMFALSSELARVTSPLLHDSDTDHKGDREFRQRNALGITVLGYMQRMAPVSGMQWRDTAQFITRFDAPRADAYGEPTLVGIVGMQAYAQWLASNYGLTVGWSP